MSAGIDIRPLGLHDGAAMQAFVRGLSWGARVARFFAPVNELSARQLQRVLSCGAAGAGLSLAALDGQGRIVAHGQYAVDADGTAEFAIVVSDAWQGRGLGERLVAALLEHARNAGVTVFRGVTLADNGPMRLLARKLGFAFKRDDDPQLVRLERYLGAGPAGAAA